MTTMNIELGPLCNAKVLCAVSGGADSMCLLHLLWSEGIEVTAAHYEHGIRGEESLRDCRFVESWCGRHGIACVTEHGDVPAYAKAQQLGTEEAARTLRYNFLNKTAERLGCQYIATAHNADDNAETVLLNLARGSGAKGLSGIPYERESIIRPLLNVTRAEIEKYLLENNIPHVEDSSNSTDEYTRNLIRHRVSPVLREINPAISNAIGRSSRLLQRDDDCLSGLAEDFITEHFRDESLPLKELSALHPAVSGRVLRKLLGRGMSMEHVDAALKLCLGQGYGSIDLPGIRLVREQGRLYLGKADSDGLPERELVPGAPLELPEAGLRIMAECVIYRKEINDLFKTYYLKYENIDFPLYCGGRRDGDRLRPMGRGCGKSLRQLFREAGYTKQQRDLCPVIRDAKGVLAVYRLAVDERCRAAEGDKALKISVMKSL